MHESRYGEVPGLNYGFIAQEVEKVIPEFVSVDSEGYYWYNPSGFEAILTAAVQEQQQQISELSSILSVDKGGNVSISTGDGELTVQSTGNVGIGTTAPSTILAVVQASATDPIADAWTTYSSRRWKENFQPIEGALDKVKRLRGVYFDWKANGKHDIGMIAEDVGEIIPEVVAYEKNHIDAKSLDYARLVALLVEAIKEQQAQIEALQAEVSGMH